MKRSRIVVTVLLAIVLALALCACDCEGEETTAPPNQHNIVARQSWGISPDLKYILRYDYNEFGKPLGITYLDLVTLQPDLCVRSGNDVRYGYDENGKLVSHSIGGTPLALELGENGLPKLGRGGVGARPKIYRVEYEFDANGSIVSEKHSRGSEPYVDSHVYEYDSLGRVVKCDKDTFTYSDTSIEMSVDGEKYTLTLNAAGLPTELKSDARYLPYCTWQYDDAGRCVRVEADCPATGSVRNTCDFEYDEAGKLLSAERTAWEKNSYEPYKTVIEHRYDESGALVEVTERNIYSESASRSCITYTYKIEDGVYREWSSEQYKRGEGGDEWLFVKSQASISDTQYSICSYLYEKGKSEGVISNDDILKYDSYGRPVSEVVKKYDDGELEGVTERTTEYDADWNPAKTVESLTSDPDYYGTPSTVTKEYSGGVLRRETKEFEFPIEDGNHYTGKSVIEYDGDGNKTWLYEDRYINGEPFFDGTFEYDMVPGNGIWLTETSNYYESYNLQKYDREIRKKVVIVYDEKLEKHTRVYEYVGEVLSYESYETYESDGVYVEDGGYQIRREKYGEYKYYDAEGRLERSEVIDYEYHETDYIAKKSIKVYDASGALTRSYVESYDEKGILISTVDVNE